MQRHHEAGLDQALDELYLKGAVSVSWDYLYLWFNADRLSKGAYRELQRRWDELCTITHAHSEVPELSVLKTNNSFITIIRKPFKEQEKLISLAMWT
jgi:hypothetical protein